MKLLRVFALIGVMGSMALTACGGADQFTAYNTQGDDNSPAAFSNQSIQDEGTDLWALPTQKATVGKPENFPTPAHPPTVVEEGDPTSAQVSTLPTQPATVDPNAETPATPTHGQVSEDQIAKDRPASKDVQGTSSLKPTVYFFPVFDEDKKTCSDSEKVTLHGQGGKALIRVCKKNSLACGLQGSCTIKQKGKIRMLNILARIKGQNRYFEINREECKYGYGVSSVCLDPFHTLAADLSVYKLGEVIYIPSVIGLILPDGSLHDGYFIIRDKGAGINGRGRFDFYSGFVPWYEKTNPFNRIGLADKNTAVPYLRITGAKAAEIKARRAFPRIPADNQPLKPANN
ncbi:3D domain-containing protein [Bdellovibrio sp. SKB1291214]|uniref:3D domain-containing protein n=1 Tax=Bdellovibrio sp. SKB1291214 TaxID=1732569 RepID=UPI000B51CAC2|nr:3D domain-containing protein [Bdellovibrio sp. SKB1291214]UYL07770.1 3D domain-containing protein [Bdellovibrio sp. SKB1291214]